MLWIQSGNPSASLLTRFDFRKHNPSFTLHMDSLPSCNQSLLKHNRSTDLKLQADYKGKLPLDIKQFTVIFFAVLFFLAIWLKMTSLVLQQVMVSQNKYTVLPMAASEEKALEAYINYFNISLMFQVQYHVHLKPEH